MPPLMHREKANGRPILTLVVIGLSIGALFSVSFHATPPLTITSTATTYRSSPQDRRLVSQYRLPMKAQQTSPPSFTWHQCVGTFTDPHQASLHQTCQFHNLCVDPDTQHFVYYRTTRNESLTFMYSNNPNDGGGSGDKDIHGEFLGVSGRVEERSRDVVFDIRDGPLPELGSAMTWLGGSHAFAQLHGAANGGHLLLETAIPVLHMLHVFQEEVRSSRLVLRDTCHDRLDWWTLGDSTEERCTKLSSHYLNPIFAAEPTKLADLVKGEGEEKKMVCFDRVVMGMSTLGLHQNRGEHRGLDYTFYRRIIQEVHALKPAIRCDQFHVVFHRKVGRRTILNADDIYTHLMANLPTYHGIPINITVINLDDLPFGQAIQEITDLDIFMSPGGSALFHSILMHNGAVLIGNQLWDDKGKVLDFEFDILANIPYVRVQMIPLKEDQIESPSDAFTASGAKLDLDAVLTEFKQALYYSYSYKQKYYCNY